MNGSSNLKGGGADIILEGPRQAEYEALLVGLDLTLGVSVCRDILATSLWRIGVATDILW
ncbi:hypothetical protein CR513_44870, partial [Mucuna pruriens]